MGGIVSTEPAATAVSHSGAKRPMAGAKSKEEEEVEEEELWHHQV